MSDVTDAIGGLLEEARQQRAVSERQSKSLEQVVETLLRIDARNAEMAGMMRQMLERQRDSERRIGAAESVLEDHASRIEALEARIA